jgi:hypothetical protein
VNGNSIEGGERYRVLVGGVEDTVNNEQAANARLIAAAPDLLGIVQDFANEKETAVTLMMARKVLARIEGRSK